MLDVPRELAEYVRRLLPAERRRRGTRTRTRALICFRQAVLGARWFRHNVDLTAPARDHGVSRATGYRYLDEIADLSAAMSLNTGVLELRTNCQFGLNFVTLRDSIALGPESPQPGCPTCSRAGS